MANSFDLRTQMDCAESKCLSCGAPLPEGREEQRRFTGGQMMALVFGDNSTESDKLYDNVVKAVKECGRYMEVHMITDSKTIEDYHIKKLPALIINGSIISQGIVSSVEDIKMEIEYMY